MHQQRIRIEGFASSSRKPEATRSRTGEAGNRVQIRPTFAEPYWSSGREVLLLKARDRDDRVVGTQKNSPVNDPEGLGADWELTSRCDLFAAAALDGPPLLLSWEHNCLGDHFTRRYGDLFDLSVPKRRFLEHVARWAMLVAALVWLAAVAFAQSEHGVFLLFVAVYGAAATYHFLRVDLVLFRVLLYQFEFWFLLSQGTLVVCFWWWAQHETRSAVFQMSFALPLLLHLALLVTQDTAVKTLSWVRCSAYITSLALLLQLFVRDLSGDSMGVQEYQVCIFLCSDTRRMLLVGAWNLFMFFSKHFLHIIKGLLAGHRSFVTIRLPMSITAGAADPSKASQRARNRYSDAQVESIRDVHLTDTLDGPPVSDSPRRQSQHQLRAFSPAQLQMLAREKTGPAPRLSMDDSAVLEHSRTVGAHDTADDEPTSMREPGSRADVLPSSEVSRGPRELNVITDQDAFAPTFIRITTRVSATFRPAVLSGKAAVGVERRCDALMVVTPFDPVVRFVWARKLSLHPAYRVCVILFAITSALVVALSFINDNASLNWLMSMGVCFVALIEFTRFDRSLVLAVMGRFEWALLMFNLLQLTVFGTWSQEPVYKAYSTAPLFLAYAVVVGLGLGLSDAAPAYPYALRLTFAIVMFVNTLRTLIFNYVSPYYERHPVCFIFCTDTAVLSLSPTFTMVIFLAKYAVSLLRHRNRSIIACTHLTVTVIEPTQPVHSSSTSARSISTMPPSSSSGEPILDHPEHPTCRDAAVDDDTKSAVEFASSSSADPRLRLPVGWARAEDPAGMPYYYNETTGQTVWEVEDII